MRVNGKIFGVLVLAVFWGVIGLSVVSGAWNTRGPEFSLESVESPEDIRGWMKVGDVCSLFPVPEADLLAARAVWQPGG